MLKESTLIATIHGLNGHPMTFHSLLKQAIDKHDITNITVVEINWITYISYTLPSFTEMTITIYHYDESYIMVIGSRWKDNGRWKYDNDVVKIFSTMVECMLYLVDYI